MVCTDADGWAEVSLHEAQPVWEWTGSDSSAPIHGVTARLRIADHLGNGNGLSTPLVTATWLRDGKWVEVAGGLTEVDTKRFAQGLAEQPLGGAYAVHVWLGTPGLGGA
jgi:hypothetical protein